MRSSSASPLCIKGTDTECGDRDVKPAAKVVTVKQVVTKTTCWGSIMPPLFGSVLKKSKADVMADLLQGNTLSLCGKEATDGCWEKQCKAAEKSL